jgi:hypothetical protein
MENLKFCTVLYRIESTQGVLDAPFGFECQAEDADHAEEQCLNAYPNCDVVWVYEGKYQDALNDYWRE